MLFNSIAFAVFLPTVLLLYWSMRHRTQNALLLGASLLFYGWWDWRFLSLLVLSATIDYAVALRIEEGRAATSARKRQKLLLASSIVSNLGILGFFKYFDFFAGSLAELMGTLGLTASTPLLEIVLPVGISFYTFQSMSYTIDVYRGDMQPTRRYLDFLLYVAFFPQLVAGPIERARVLLPQILRPRQYDRDQFFAGVNLILWGLFKKVFVADNLAPLVAQGFADETLAASTVMLAAYAFAFQIYCDFSGYSNIARGCAKCMGFELMVNFRNPYLATNPSDFWRRWHISLSTWLRDYLYIPLGGNRSGRLSVYRNLAITMLLGGLWHGATWLFVAWGAYQGLLLITHRLIAPWLRSISQSFVMPAAIATALKIAGMFQLVCVGWLIFRGESVGQIWDMLSAIATLRGPVDLTLLGPIAALVLPLILLEIVQQQVLTAPRARRIPAWVRAPAYAVITYLFAFHGGAAQNFIYFQF